MKGYLAFAAVAGAAIASPFPQAPSAPAGCSSSRAGSFGISVVNVTQSAAKRGLETRQGPNGALSITLQDGVLKDANGRTGCIVANRQFQFDNPIQDNAIYTSGWSVCQNGSLALTSAIFYQCLSGEFYNLYDQSQGGQCNPVYIVATGGAAGSAAPSPAAPPAPSGSVAQITDGQPQAPSQTVSQIGDGQVQATSGAATQIPDGQIQAPTGGVSQIGDGQIQAPTGSVTQIGDGQIQAPTGSVTQIGDGQIQAPTGSVTQIGDGQIQAPTGAVSQIGDGQIQAPTGSVTQIGDGQIQAPTGSVTQIGDGQIQAPTGTPAIATYVGAAPRELAGSFAFVAGIVGAIALL